MCCWQSCSSGPICGLASSTDLAHYSERTTVRLFLADVRPIDLRFRLGPGGSDFILEPDSPELGKVRTGFTQVLHALHTPETLLGRYFDRIPCSVNTNGPDLIHHH